MITIRRAEDRGHFDHGWLETYHSFSFAGYYDPRHMGFRSLRVINEDWVQPGRGFGTHPHRDMEIITYVLEGALEHKDSTGGGGVIRPGEVQYMCAGTGVTHSEFNHSRTEPVHLLQIWIEPAKEGLEPGYDQKTFDRETVRGRLTLIASPDGAEQSLSINQDARVYASVLEKGQQLSHDLAPGRHAWLQVARGRVQVNGQRLAAGDGAAVSDESRLSVTAEEPAELLLFDLA
jgi:redox-sensitive bicupin YhaK (pirin superfamily)